jgi:DNA-binding XRE family transcriptional regulator
MAPQLTPNVYVRAHRKAAGFNQAELGVAIGANEKAVQRIERGELIGSLRNYVMMAKVLRCSVDDLVPDCLREEPLPDARRNRGLPRRRRLPSGAR